MCDSVGFIRLCHWTGDSDLGVMSGHLQIYLFIYIIILQIIICKFSTEINEVEHELHSSNVSNDNMTLTGKDRKAPV